MVIIGKNHITHTHFEIKDLNNFKISNINKYINFIIIIILKILKINRVY